MTTQEKIKAILSQKNYSVEKGRVLRYDDLAERFKPVQVSGNRIYLVKHGSSPEIFDMATVLEVIDGMNGAAKNVGNVAQYSQITTMADGSKTVDHVLIEVNPIPDFKGVKGKKVAPKKKETVVNSEGKKPKKSPTKKSKKKSQKLREKEIAYIRKNYLKISINKMAKELGVTRHPVMYVVKQIKAGKTLKYEK